MPEPSGAIWTEEHTVRRPDRVGRRRFLSAAGLSLAAAAGGAGIYNWLKRAAIANGGGPVVPQTFPHSGPGKQLIFVFLTGGFSHIDTFDPKPQLSEHHGKLASEVYPSLTLPITFLGSPFRFSQSGESGIWISELFPELASVADKLCVLRGMYSPTKAHVQSALMMHSGSERVPLPSIGSWVSYGLGTLNPDLPSYVVFCEKEPYGGAQVWDSGFLPRANQGVRLYPGDHPIKNLVSTAPAPSLDELERQMLRDANELYASARPGDFTLQAREKSFDTATGLMRIAPHVFNLADETKDTLNLYGVTDGDNQTFAAQCLTARRLIEEGVRTVELIESGQDARFNWDSHDDINTHIPRARAVDQALAALIKDLDQRSLLDQTVVAICTEFGRTPWFNDLKTKGRNHLSSAFTCLLAGGGVKGSCVYGETDDFGAKVVAGQMHVHDYHATILQLLGIDHRQLTYRYAGRDFRLTDIGGHIPQEILA
jgi:Protein of unknown function (DUF1501)